MAKLSKLIVRNPLESKIAGLTKGQFMRKVIDWSLEEKSEGKFELTFLVNQKQLSEIEESLGLRILMTDRHDWDTADIMKAYHAKRFEQDFSTFIGDGVVAVAVNSAIAGLIVNWVKGWV